MYSLTLILVTLGPQAALGTLKFPPFLISAPAQQITSRGHNSQALFLDNERIVFISRDRHRNEDPQIYLKHLSSGEESQITHQRGKLQMGVILPDKKQMVYASSTDTDKENPVALRQYLDRFPSSIDQGRFVSLELQPQELYLGSWDGSQVERLTDHPAFDGAPTFHRSHRLLYFSRHHKDLVQLYALSLNKPERTWQILKSQEHDFGVSLSQDSKYLVWSRFDKDFNQSQLLLSTPKFKTIKELTQKDGIYWGASFHPQRSTVIYAAKRGAMSNFDLFEIDIKGECQRQLTAYEGDEFFPQISPDGKKIMFTSTQAGGEQIFMIEDPQEPLECHELKDKASLPLTEAA